MSSRKQPAKLAVRRTVPRSRAPVSSAPIRGYGAYRQGSRPKARTQIVRAQPEPAPTIGESIGRNIGGFIGKGIQGLIKNITGFGEYHVEENTILDGGMSPPQIVNSVNTGGFILRHREFIGDIYATTAFTLQSYEINPGLSTTFPWLANVADGFEEYQMRGLVFEFKTMSADSVLSNSTSSALGSVIMATSYNSLNPNFASKLEMENYEFANSSRPSTSFMHPVECKRSLMPVNHLYVRTAAIQSGDQRLYDLGKFQIATVGMQAASGVIGELWCTYEVELYHPRYNINTAPPLTTVLCDHWKLVSVATAAPFGTSRSLASGSNMNGVITTNNTYTFPNSITGRRFLIVYYGKYTGSPGTYTVQNNAFYGMTVQQVWNNAVDNTAYAPYSSGSTNVFMQAWIVQISADGANFNLSGGAIPSCPYGDLMIVSVTNDYTLDTPTPSLDYVSPAGCGRPECTNCK